jgi:DedD protein
MGIFSFGKKDEAPARRSSSSGSNRGSNRRSNDNGRVERRSRRPDRSGDAEAMLLDPTLPEKQRARRRLIGAIALVVAAVVVLPMILDTHPKPVTDDIAIDIPSRPAPKTPARGEADDIQAGVAPDSPPAAADAAPGLAAANPPAASAPVAAPKSTQTAQAKKPAPATTTAKRQALPSDTDVQPGSSSNEDAGTPAAPPGARYALQLGSFADDAKARSWQAKLKAAGVPAYTEHRKQPDGTTRTLLRAGPFPDRAAASAAIAKVRSAGLGAGANNGGAD